MGGAMTMKTPTQIRAKVRELKKRVECGYPIMVPMRKARRIRDTSAREMAELALTWGIYFLEWALGRDEQERARKEREGDYE